MFDFLDVYPYLLPVIIFFGRIVDVTLGTLRIIFVSKGEKLKAPVIGFFEILIWVVVISQVLSRADSMIAYLSYAAGYAAGNYVGILIEKRIAFGIILCRVYTNKSGFKLRSEERRVGNRVEISVVAVSLKNIKEYVTIFDRKQLKNVSSIILSFDKDAFYVIEDVRTRSRGVFPKTSNLLRRWRPGK